MVLGKHLSGSKVLGNAFPGKTDQWNEQVLTRKRNMYVHIWLQTEKMCPEEAGQNRGAACDAGRER